MGDVFCSGWNNFGQLGRGVPDERQGEEVMIFTLVPTLSQEMLQGACIHQIACGSNHTIALSGPKSTLGTDLLQLLHSGEFSDFSLEVEGKKILSHRCILSARSHHWREV